MRGRLREIRANIQGPSTLLADASAIPPLADLTNRYGSAELTAAILQRKQPVGGRPTFINALSILVFGDGIGSLEPAAFLTTMKESGQFGRDFRLIFTRSRLTIPEATAMLTFSGEYVDPRVPSGDAVACPGTWVGPYVVGAGELRVRTCLPPFPGMLWLRELRPDKGLWNELTAEQIDRLYEKVESVLHLRLREHPDRVGGFLAVFPDDRAEVDVKLSDDTTRLGVEIRLRGLNASELTMVLSGMRDEEVVAQICMPCPDRRAVVDLGSAVQSFDLALVGADGRAVYRGSFGFLRTIGFAMQLVTAQGTVAFRCSNGEVIESPMRWGSVEQSFAGGNTTWEDAERRARALIQQRELLEDGHLYFFEGGDLERSRAVAKLRELISRAREFLYIWDPFLDEADLFRFLSAVSDRSTEIRLLTAVPKERESENGSEQEPSAGHGSAVATRRDAKIRRVRDALSQLRDPSPSLTGLHSMQAALGPRRLYHDRFILTRDLCWQLGCSLNQIGAVVSTIVEFPYPDLVHRSFEAAWGDAVRAGGLIWPISSGTSP